jgi:glyoxylase-like metal-dependent hydrolase (beta-lactamase superfamily II)
VSARIDHAVTLGTIQLDSGPVEVDNNVWVVGDDTECVLIDAPHQVEPVTDLVGQRRVRAILCTHAHNDHINVARQLAERYAVPVWLHPADEPLWAMTHPDFAFTALADHQRFSVAGVALEVLHTPGHTPGAVCYRVADLGVVFTGDTLFHGGPGATGRPFSSFPTIIESIRTRLLTLPGSTIVHTGHGESTTIAAEAPHLDEWIARGW